MGTSKFCSDIVYEILSRTNMKSLDQCKMVCKEWNEIPNEPTFLPLHCERTNSISGYFVQYYKQIEYVTKFVSFCKSSEVSLEFLPRRMKFQTKIFASSKSGILCCLSEEHKKYRFLVCKPTTQQWRALPNPKMRFFTIKIAMVVMGSDPLRYKIVRLSEPKRRSTDAYNFHCEIFDPKTWKWKLLPDIILSYEDLFDIQSAVVINESIFWLLTTGHVINFDINTETYTIFSLPKLPGEEAVPYKRTKQLIEYKAKLGYILQEEDLKLWVLEDSRNNVWELRKEEFKSRKRQRAQYSVPRLLECRCHGDVWLL